MQTIYDYFDKIYCISLEKRADRRVHFKENYPNLGVSDVTYWNAVDGTLVDAPATWEWTKGLYGCTLSHAAVINDAIQHGYEAITVFEDDAVVSDKFLETALPIMKDLQGKEWDMVIWGYINLEPPVPVTDRYQRLTRNLHAHAISYSKTGLEKMHREFTRDELLPNDYILGDIVMKEGFVYAPYENLATQRGDYSDVENRYTFQFKERKTSLKVKERLLNYMNRLRKK
jgi:hypothetical protein